MPIKTPRPCSVFGCTKLTRERYCAEHKIEKKGSDWVRTKEQQKKRVRNPIYSTAQWRDVRRMALRRSPACAVDGCNKLATEVDHIVPISKGGQPFDLENLQGLCCSCHARKTLQEQHKDRKVAQGNGKP